MFSATDPDIVLTNLGDKFLAAFSTSVTAARKDIDTLRGEHPDWFPPMHPRTLAALIHDRIWAHLCDAVDNDPAVVTHEHGPTRELQVGTNFRLRVKRHHPGNLISSYPTQGALEFYIQPAQPTLDGLELITLAAGYKWDKDLRRIESPVLSYRDGKDNPIWAVELEEPQNGAEPIRWTPVTGPDLPRVDLGDGQKAGETGTVDES